MASVEEENRLYRRLKEKNATLSPVAETENQENQNSENLETFIVKPSEPSEEPVALDFKEVIVVESIVIE